MPGSIANSRMLHPQGTTNPDGIAGAKELGIQFGAKPKLTQEQIIELKIKRESGVLVKDLMNLKTAVKNILIMSKSDNIRNSNGFTTSKSLTQ